MKSPHFNQRLRRLVALISLLCAFMVSLVAAPAGAASQSPATGQPQPSTAAQDHYEVHFENKYHEGVYIALMYYNPQGICEFYGGWEKQGWWHLNRGEKAYLIDTKNRYFYYYAESEDRDAHWSGALSTYVRPQQFLDCHTDKIPWPSPWYRVGMRQVDMGPTYTNYTVTLIPGRDQANGQGPDVHELHSNSHTGSR